MPARPVSTSKDFGLNCLNANLRAAVRTLTSFYADRMRETGLEPSQYTILANLVGFGEMSIGELSDVLVMDQTTVSRTIKRMNDNGLVMIARGEDKRQKNVRVTAKGARQQKAAYPVWRSAQRDAWEKLGDSGAKKTLELSKKIINSFC